MSMFTTIKISTPLTTVRMICYKPTSSSAHCSLRLAHGRKRTWAWLGSCGASPAAAAPAAAGRLGRGAAPDILRIETFLENSCGSGEEFRVVRTEQVSG